MRRKQAVSVEPDGPAEIKTRLEDACKKAIEDPEFVEFMNNNGQAISFLDSAGYAEFLEQSATDVAEAMKAVNLV